MEDIHFFDKGDDIKKSSLNEKSSDTLMDLSKEEDIIRSIIVSGKVTFGSVFSEYLLKRTFDNVEIREITKIAKWTEARLALLIDEIYDELDYLSSLGIKLVLSINDTGQLKLSERDSNDNALELLFGFYENTVIFSYRSITYIYQRGIFKDSIVEYLKGD